MIVQSVSCDRCGALMEADLNNPVIHARWQGIALYYVDSEGDRREDCIDLCMTCLEAVDAFARTRVTEPDV